MERALSLFQGKLGLRIASRKEVGPDTIQAWGLPPESQPEVAYVNNPASPASMGLRLMQTRSPSPGTLRGDVPTYHPGLFGISMGTQNQMETLSVLLDVGAQLLSAPHIFEARALPSDNTRSEVIVRMPEGYYITVFDDPTEKAPTEVPIIATFSIVSRIASDTDRFWDTLLGWKLSPITRAVHCEWSETRNSPPDEPIDTGRFYSHSGGNVYRVNLPNLCPPMEPIPPDINKHGICLMGVASDDIASVNSLPDKIASWNEPIPPWNYGPLALISAPDGALVEFGPSAATRKGTT